MPRMKRTVSILLTCALAIGAAFLLSGCADSSGGTTTDDAPMTETTPDNPQPTATVTSGPIAGVTVRDSVDEYSWEELGMLADGIAAADSDEAGLQIAVDYNLCDDDGTLDGTQVKSFLLTDGTQAQAQIVGFRHDDKSDASGKSGISFITKECVTKRAMDSSGDNDGGWEASELRTWMNSELLAEFPEDLRAQIVPVDKLTNNVGQTEDVASVTVTSDTLWLPSEAELCGNAIDWYGDDHDAILNAEGTQYQLFADAGVRLTGTNKVLVRSVQGTPCIWWERSACPDGPRGFAYTTTDGTTSHSNDWAYIHYEGVPIYYYSADYLYGVAPGFCV